MLAPSCDITIELDPAHAEGVKPDEPLRGHIVLRTNRDAGLKALKVRTEYHTQGKGNKVRRRLALLELAQDTHVSASQPLRVPFEYNGTNGPPTYSGRYVSVHWQLKVEAEFPGLFDPKAELSFTRLRGEKPDPLPNVDYSQGTKLSGCARGFVLFMLLIFFGAGAIMFLAGNEEGGADAVGFYIGGALFMLFGSVGLYFVLRNYIAMLRLGKVVCEVGPRHLYPGEGIAALVSFTPKKQVNLNGVVAKLLGEEVAVFSSGSGKSKRTRTYRDTFFEQEFDAGLAGSFPAQQLVQVPFQMQLPADALPSFRLPHNRVEWTVQIRIDIQGLPDYRDSFKLEVY